LFLVSVSASQEHINSRPASDSGVSWGQMKREPHPKPIAIPEDLAARCTGDDQFEKFDSMFRNVISVPKAEIDKQDAKWKRAQAKERQKPA